MTAAMVIEERKRVAVASSIKAGLTDVGHQSFFCACACVCVRALALVRMCIRKRNQYYAFVFKREKQQAVMHLKL